MYNSSNTIHTLLPSGPHKGVRLFRSAVSPPGSHLSTSSPSSPACEAPPSRSSHSPGYSRPRCPCPASSVHPRNAYGSEVCRLLLCYMGSTRVGLALVLYVIRGDYCMAVFPVCICHLYACPNHCMAIVQNLDSPR